jgi:hypothetical protein
MNIQCADPAHIAMLNVCVYRPFFTTLIAHGDIGINVDLFHKIVAMMEGDTFFEYDARKAKLRVSDENTVFEMACFEFDGEQFEFPAEEIAQMTPVEFLDGTTADMVETIKKWTAKFKTDSVRFEITDDRLTLSAETMETTIKKRFSIMGSDKNWETRINTKYLTQLPKTNNTLVLSWRHDFPVMIEESTPLFTMQTFVAPMMDD